MLQQAPSPKIIFPVCFQLNITFQPNSLPESSPQDEILHLGPLFSSSNSVLSDIASPINELNHALALSATPSLHHAFVSPDRSPTKADRQMLWSRVSLR